MPRDLLRRALGYLQATVYTPYGQLAAAVRISAMRRLNRRLSPISCDEVLAERKNDRPTSLDARTDDNYFHY